jgi:hypothetical protein
MHVRTTAGDLARWLDQNGGVWTVEGEPALAQSLPVPTPAGILADALRERPGELVLLAPDGCALADEAYAGPAELRDASHDVDGNRVFQLAWVAPDGATKDSWLLAEHAVLLSGVTPSDGGRNAAALLDMLQKGSRATVPRMRKG